MTDMLKEARRLYDLGIGVHWLWPGKKSPVKEKWTAPTRDPWEMVEAEYVPGNGLGCRMGAASKLGGGYLANIDIDVKSSDPRHETEALAFVNAKFPGLFRSAPLVRTGYGYRLYFLTAEPMASGKLGASPETCKVLMPTDHCSLKRRQKLILDGLITAVELEQGWRIKAAWEVELMSQGRQTVAPPTIHPDTKKRYRWIRELKTVEDLFLVDIGSLTKSSKSKTRSKAETFTPVDVDLSRLGLDWRQMIDSGEGIDGDRSGPMMSATMAMVRAGYTDDEITSVMTMPNTTFSDCCKDHTKGDRNVQARWFKDYTLANARASVDATKAFEVEVLVTPNLEGEAVVEQEVEIVDDEESRPWQSKLKRNDKGVVKKTIDNLVMILEGTYGPGLFKEDMFSGHRVFGIKVPWGGEVDGEFNDLHRPLLLDWFCRIWGLEPGAGDLFDVVAIIAAKYRFHPIQDQLRSLVWDGMPRIDTWLVDYMKAKGSSNAYLRGISRKFLVAMVKRAFEPGCQFDYMLILRGEQGVKKSSALKILAGIKYYTSTSLRPGDKDTIAKMAGKWVVEFGELSTIKKDVRTLKDFITTQIDRDRMSYDHVARDFPRKCVFAGSTNEFGFLVDTTGNRRFWVTEVGMIDLEALKRDRDQLMAEAVLMYDLGEELYLSKEVEADAKLEQDKWAPHHDIMLDRVAKVIKANMESDKDAASRFPPDGFTLFEIMDHIPGNEDDKIQKRVIAALRANGYEVKNARREGKKMNLWFKNSAYPVPTL